jgi:N-acetylglucosaminyl-diphospho-decaprenol L-rhamnosyltransferase
MLAGVPVPTDASSLSVVIVSCNERDHLARNLESLGVESRSVVVVDNASRDGTSEFLRERYPDIRLIELDENRGYGTAANIGFAATQAAFALLLNADVWAIGNAVDRLVAYATEHPTAGVVVPAFLDVEGRRQPSLIGYPTEWWLGRPPVTSSQGRAAPRSPSREAFAVGAAMLFRRAAIDQTGGFDEDFFLFFEEVDLCRRLLDAGWAIHSCEDAQFVHVGGVSARRDWSRAYRVHLQGYLRYLTNHRGSDAAERARRRLRHAVRVRALLASGGERSAFAEAAAWLRSGDASTLIRERL